MKCFLQKQLLRFLFFFLVFWRTKNWHQFGICVDFVSQISRWHIRVPILQSQSIQKKIPIYDLGNVVHRTATCTCMDAFSDKISLRETFPCNICVFPPVCQCERGLSSNVDPWHSSFFAKLSFHFIEQTRKNREILEAINLGWELVLQVTTPSLAHNRWRFCEQWTAERSDTDDIQKDDHNLYPWRQSRGQSDCIQVVTLPTLGS